MSKQTARQMCESIQKYYINRMCDLCEENRSEDATSMYEEIREWLMQKEKPKILTIKINQPDKT
jgi:hypothetical protein